LLLKYFYILSSQLVIIIHQAFNTFTSLTLNLQLSQQYWTAYITTVTWQNLKWFHLCCCNIFWKLWGIMYLYNPFQICSCKRLQLGVVIRPIVVNWVNVLKIALLIKAYIYMIGKRTIEQCTVHCYHGTPRIIYVHWQLYHFDYQNWCKFVSGTTWDLRSPITVYLELFLPNELNVYAFQKWTNNLLC
jgi:hypothetical protein